MGSSPKPPGGTRAVAERLWRLQAITDTALAHLALDDLLRELLSRITQILDSDAARILLLSDDGQHFVLRAAHGLEEQVERGLRLRVGEGVTSRIAQSREPVIVEDLATADPGSPALTEGGVRSLLGAPLLVEGRVIGVLEVGTREPRRFTRDAAHLLQLVADRAALAIDRAKLFETMKVSEQQQAIVAELGQRALEGIALVPLIEEAVGQVAQTLGVEYCEVLELQPDGATLLLRAGVGWRHGAVGQTTDRTAPDSLAAHVLAAAEPVAVEELDLETRFGAPPRLIQHGVVSGLSVAIRGLDQPFGILAVHTGRRRSFSADDRHFLLAVSHVFGMAIERHRAEEGRARRLEEAQVARVEAETQVELAQRLQAVTDAALAHLGLDSLLAELLRRIRELLVADTAAILLVDASGETLVARATHGLEESVTQPLRLPLGQGFTGRVAAERRVVTVTDLDQSDVIDPVLRERGVRSLIGAPLGVGDRVIGIVRVGTVRPRRFSPDDAHLLQLVADRAALAIDHARLFEAERAARRDAEAANRTKDEFLAMLSHELRNPLAPILNALHVLNQTASRDPDSARLRAIIERQARQLARLVDDLLDVSRIRSGTFVLRREPVDVRDVARQCLEAFHVTGRLGDHDIALVLGPEPAMVNGDPVRLEQAIGHLLDNAAKYTVAGGAIRLQVDRERGEAVVRVQDEGAGIPPELLPRVFDVFAQGPRSVDRPGGGLGLGLALARSLVEQHEGSISAHSPGSGQGSEFVIRLPIRAPDRPGRAAEGPVAWPTRHVLVIEDYADAREALRLVLELGGHRVEVAEDGVRGLELACRSRPEFALIDIGLPGLDGYEVARRLRATPEGQRMYLIALTGYGQPADRRRALEAGFDTHLVKPVDPAELASILGAFVPPRG
ncbi:MAG TPA: GAF domain-containing protein [Methylomirabilota bacterium]|nr:GAF domain-containing protein [Methylomirabilota bacterium]